MRKKQLLTLHIKYGELSNSINVGDFKKGLVFGEPGGMAVECLLFCFVGFFYLPGILFIGLAALAPNFVYVQKSLIDVIESVFLSSALSIETLRGASPPRHRC